MSWLGHKDSKMVRRYYHLLDTESRRRMSQIEFVKVNFVDKATGAMLVPAKSA